MKIEYNREKGSIKEGMRKVKVDGKRIFVFFGKGATKNESNVLEMMLKQKRCRLPMGKNAAKNVIF